MIKIRIPRRRKPSTKKAAIILVMVALVASAMPTVAFANRLGEGRHAQDQEQKLQLQEEYSLQCEANLNHLNGESVREDMEIETEEKSPPTQMPTMAPSQSPSLSVPCSDPFSNARGSYTSSKAPCTISFHNEDEGTQPMNPLGANRKRYHDRSDDTTSTYYRGTSNVCGSENKIGEAKEYVSAWPDECVGDFARCYDLSDPNHLMCQGLKKVLGGLRDLRRLEELDTSNHLPWTARDFHENLVPPGTTHISIDCTVDKEALLESYQQQKDLYHELIEERVSATKRQTLFVVVAILVAVLIVVFAISQLVVQPIVDVWSRGQQRNNNDEGGNQLVSLVSHTNVLRLETMDGDANVEVDEEEGASYVEETLEVCNQEFEAQTTIQEISMDFDAVPIVPATIIPIEAIPAEVMEDGITYYP